MDKAHGFLSSCTSGGCGAKIGPGELGQLLAALPVHQDPRLLVGYDTSDDAAVYRLDGEHSLISTIDFFPPMVDDPASFGRISAANAMSDVWAMGGQPVLALNMVCFPEQMDRGLLAAMLSGGAEKISEAGAVLGGGHSIYDKEPKYGLAVSGLVKTDQIIRNNTPRVGDKLILTKPLGVGIVMAAARVDEAAADHLQGAVASMERLNGYAAGKMAGYSISACTDITGFGLLAHLCEMLAGRARLRLYPDRLPLLPGAADYADAFLLTAAGQRNRNHLGGRVPVDKLPFAVQELLFDPQTSGGLLMAVPAEQADALLADIRQVEPRAALIGEVLPRGESEILFG